MSDRNKDNKEVMENIAKDISDKSAAMFFVNSEGSMTMITTGEMSKEQKKVCTKMLVASGNHSIILAVVLSLEINFEKLIYKFLEWFKRLK